MNPLLSAMGLGNAPVPNPNLAVSPQISNILGGGGDPPDNDLIDLRDSKGVKAGKYSRAKIMSAIKAARAVGVDPAQYLALGWQESDLGNAKVKGRRGSWDAPFAMAHDIDDNQQKEIEALAQKTGVDPLILRGAVALRGKLQYAKQLGFKDEASALQAYNGYGTITPKQFGGATQAYGVDISNGVDMRKNPLYGKRLLELKQDILKNKAIQQLLNQQ